MEKQHPSFDIAPGERASEKSDLFITFIQSAMRWKRAKEVGECDWWWNNRKQSTLWIHRFNKPITVCDEIYLLIVFFISTFLLIINLSIEKYLFRRTCSNLQTKIRWKRWNKLSIRRKNAVLCVHGCFMNSRRSSRYLNGTLVHVKISLEHFKGEILNQRFVFS